MPNTGNTGPNPGDSNSVVTTQTPVVEVFGTPSGTNPVPRWNAATQRFEWLNADGTYAPLQPGLASAKAAPSVLRRTPRTVLTNNPNADGWALGNADPSANVNDTANQLYGTACATIVTKGDGTTTTLSKSGMTAFDLNRNDVEILLQVVAGSALATAGGVKCRMGNNALANVFTQTVVEPDAGTLSFDGDWYRVRFTSTALAPGSAGPPFRNALTDLSVDVIDTAAAKATVRVQQVSLVAKHPHFASGGLFTVTLDDSWLSQWTNALPKLAQYGFPATVYPILDTLGDANHMSLTQLKQLRDLHGWEIAAHANTTADHTAGFTTLSAADLEAEMVAMKTWLRQNGFTSESFAYPRGLFNQAVLDATRRYFANASTTTSRPLETVPPNDVFRLRREVIDHTYSFATVQALIDNAMRQGYWYNLAFHEVSDAPVGSSYIGTALFGQIIDYLTTRGATVLTTQDALRMFDTEPATEATYPLELLDQGQETLPRVNCTASIALASGTVRFSYFTARKSEIVTKLRSESTTVVAAGLTLAKMGLYSVDAAGNLTQIATTASDTTLFTGSGVQYERATTATAYVKRGQRYAHAVLVVGTTPPQLPGNTVTGAGAEYNATSPIAGGLLAGQADLPASVAVGSLTQNSLKYYGVINPG